ncbi:MAG TPA: hypothetical protein VHM25_12790, partial [Polyangiaceae bacterium]|nr:hypothetical protein [Polyangiaceae bacterium]
MIRSSFAALLLGLLLTASPGLAAPNIWQRARDPGAAAQQTMLNRIERLLGSLGLAEFDTELSAGAIALTQLGHSNWPCLSRSSSGQDDGSNSAPDIVLDARLEYLIGGALLDARSG